MKLTIEHLAPYLPYGLELMGSLGKSLMTVDENFEKKESIGVCLAMQRKPILRPLSDLKKDEYYDNLCYSSKTLIIREDLHYNWVESIPHFDFKKLIEWHFDVFGLIEKGLAININTIES